jgi:hypothetical protein
VAKTADQARHDDRLSQVMAGVEELWSDYARRRADVADHVRVSVSELRAEHDRQLRELERGHAEELAACARYEQAIETGDEAAMRAFEDRVELALDIDEIECPP